MTTSIIGVDCHKTVHAAVAIDAQGHELGHWRGENTVTGWHELQAWGAQYAPGACWGLEGSGQYGRGLAQVLVQEGATVFEVNPRLTATMRRGSRQRTKTDRTDALAVARVVAQDQATLPVVQVADASAALAVLVAARDAVVADATRLRNRLHQHLAVLKPVCIGSWPSLTDMAAVAGLVRLELAVTQAVQAAHLLLVRQVATQLLAAMEQAAHLKQEIEHQSQAWTAPLQEIVGIGPLTAGMLAAHLGGRRFKDDAAVAMYAGVAPLEASSGERIRHRLNRGGNRCLNAILHRIVLTQRRCSVQGKAYLARRQREGKTQAEAIRALKRLLIRIIFRAWKRCQVPLLQEVQISMTLHP